MSTTRNKTGAVQDQMLETVELGQKAVLDGVRTWAETVQKLIPETPSASWNKELPSLEEAIDNAFDFASKLIDTQRQFAKDMITATEQVAHRTNGIATEANREASTAAPIPKRTAAKKQPSAKKRTAAKKQPSAKKRTAAKKQPSAKKRTAAKR
ncbi:MAG TPA: hypothetical protein VFF07_00755 [Actinomycetota bacterium]|nr:hypothetical protein [Actinomycetota bacterium]